ncbi:MAG: hypothetical protein ACRC1T_01435 [Clostridium chrysemydis]|uniref:hypothetical protein n=1 Tax=Clostridium chrysemydis TaxID=2665504 RepID=UPI003F41A07E
MSNCFDLNIDDLVYEEYDDEEIENFEDIGYSFFEGIKSKKRKLIDIIKGENINKVKDRVYEELDLGEVILSEFTGNIDGRNYLRAFDSAEYMFVPMAFMDVGSRYHCFITDRKMLIYEVGYYNKIMREYIVEDKDINRVTLKPNKDNIEFYVKKDKYNMIRTVTDFMTYFFYQGRVSINLTSKNKEQVYKIFKEKYKECKYMKYLWIAFWTFSIVFIIYGIICAFYEGGFYDLPDWFLWPEKFFLK